MGFVTANRTHRKGTTNKESGLTQQQSALGRCRKHAIIAQENTYTKGKATNRNINSQTIEQP